MSTTTTTSEIFFRRTKSEPKSAVRREEKDATEIADANKIAEKISNINIEIKAKVNEDGKTLFGSIKLSQIVDFLDAEGYKINSKFIKIPSIKELGDYEAEIRLHRNVKTTITFKVISG